MHWKFTSEKTKHWDFSLASFFSNMGQKERLRTMANISSKKRKILVGTQQTANKFTGEVSISA